LKKIGSGRVADAFVRRPAHSLPRSTRFAVEQVGGRVQRLKRVPKRGKNLPMSCANVTEV
jgi:hypothetical protein